MTDDAAPPATKTSEANEISEAADAAAKAEEGAATQEVIGRGSATEREANTAEDFSFWLRPGEQVNPFDIVDAEHLNGSHSYGLVTDIKHSTDAPSHLSNYIANDFGELTDDPNTPRQGANVARVSVMSNTDDIYMPLQTESLIRFADEEGIHRGLGIESMAEKEEELRRPIRVPAGLIQMSNGASAVADLDIDYVIGPEAAHVNISGISGLATKTSYIMFLLQSLVQILERGSREQDSAKNVAVVLINVKHNDLLAVHEQAGGNYPNRDLEMWRSMGLTAKPFDDVEYLLPAGKQTERAPDQPNSHGPLPPVGKFRIYAYALRDTYSRLRNLFADVPDEYGTMEAIIGEIADGLERAERGQGDWKDVHTWHELLFSDKSPLRQWIDNDTAPGALRRSSLLRFVRYMNRLIRDRNSGLLVEKTHPRWTTIEKEIRAIEGGKTYVVDIAKLKDHEQALVFGDIVRTVYEVMASGAEEELDLTGLDDEAGRAEAAPKKVILFVDELNKFAPKGRSSSSPLLDDLIEIAERGRSLGIVLLSAQQFASAVHDRVIGNAATRVYGRMAPTELTQAGTRGMQESVRAHLARLSKGELVLTHPIYRQPVRIVFPRPAYNQPG